MTKPLVIHSDPEILGGTPVFVGTRAPVQTLMDYLEDGDSINVFLDHFPSVSESRRSLSSSLRLNGASFRLAFIPQSLCARAESRTSSRRIEGLMNSLQKRCGLKTRDYTVHRRAKLVRCSRRPF